MTYPTASDPCARCAAAVWSGAVYCHRCGARVGSGAAERVRSDASAPPASRFPLPEIALALLAVGALVAMLVGQRLGLGRPTAADRARADSAIAADSPDR